MSENQKRLTSKRALIEDLVSGDYFTQEGFQSNYLITPRGQKVSRVKVMGTVAATFINDDESYAFAVIDDGTETMRAKFFQEMEDFEGIDEGDLVMVVGKLREYEGEIYINPEIVKQVGGPNLLNMHLAEIAKELKRVKKDMERFKELKDENPKTYEEKLADEIGEDRARAILDAEEAGPSEEKSEKEPDESKLKKEILGKIEEIDEGEGAPYEEIIDNVAAEEKEVDEVINDLLTEGTCFEPRPGRIKKL